MNQLGNTENPELISGSDSASWLLRLPFGTGQVVSSLSGCFCWKQLSAADSNKADEIAESTKTVKLQTV